MSDHITDITATDCLLVVDSDEAELKSLASMLGKVGFEILPAHTGAEALRILGHRKADLILVDMHLPDMDGFELCRRVQENSTCTDVPVIFLSANEDKNLVARALESGAVDYITKPYHKQELLSRVRTHLMLQTSRDYAKRLAQDKDEMLGMISHHLQNHLVGLHMSAQFLLDRAQESTDTKVRLMAENIRASSGQMRAFLKTFLANAAADHGLQIRLEPVNLHDAVSRALQQYADAAKAKSISLCAKMPAQAVMAKADAVGLGQVLDNLISNAIKFSSPKKEILITVENEPGHVVCRVQDHGAGFTDADKAQMFRRYARLSARPTGGEPSTGLGLSIVKRLVHAMNGELICDSTTGQGTTFTVRLAACAEPAPRPDCGSMAAQKSGARRRNKLPNKPQAD